MSFPPEGPSRPAPHPPLPRSLADGSDPPRGKALSSQAPQSFCSALPVKLTCGGALRIRRSEGGRGAENAPHVTQSGTRGDNTSSSPPPGAVTPQSARHAAGRGASRHVNHNNWRKRCRRCCWRLAGMAHAQPDCRRPNRWRPFLFAPHCPRLLGCCGRQYFGGRGVLLACPHMEAPVNSVGLAPKETLEKPAKGAARLEGTKDAI